MGEPSEPFPHLNTTSHFRATTGLDGKVQREKGSAEGRGATAYDCRSSPLNVPASRQSARSWKNGIGPFP